MEDSQRGLESAKRANIDCIVVKNEFTKNQDLRSEEHTSELQSLMRISYAVFCLKKKIAYLYFD